MTDDERLAKWRYGLGLLVAFLVGWQFAPQFAATSWYRPVTSILIIVPALGLLYFGLSQLIKENKKT